MSSIIVLFYHRVIERRVEARDPFRLQVDAARFDAQMGALAQAAEVVPLAVLVEPGSRFPVHGSRQDPFPDAALDPRPLTLPAPSPKPLAAITFDDGYRDNLLVAAPILQKHGLPATFFIASDFLQSDRGFFWDRAFALAECALAMNAPLPLIAGDYHPGKFTEPRPGAYKLVARLKRMPPGERDAVLEAMERDLGAASVPLDRYREAPLRGIAPHRPRKCCCAIKTGERRPLDAPMSAVELRELAARPGVEIGAHSASHRALVDLSAGERAAETSGCKEALESLLSRPVRHFAYPFGQPDDIGSDMPDAVREAGFELALTTSDGSARLGDNRMLLPRRNVQDWPAELFLTKLRSWADAAHRSA